MARRSASLLLLVAACSTHPAAPPVVCDGRLDEPAWRGALRTGPFHDASGGLARPYSDARIVVTRTAIYVALYAADADIRSDDHFTLHVGETSYRFGPADAGPDVGVDRDGTLDDPRDVDEEWIVEARLPRPKGPTVVHIERCDVACGAASLTLP